MVDKNIFWTFYWLSTRMQISTDYRGPFELTKFNQNTNLVKKDNLALTLIFLYFLSLLFWKVYFILLSIWCKPCLVKYKSQEYIFASLFFFLIILYHEVKNVYITLTTLNISIILDFSDNLRIFTILLCVLLELVRKTKDLL